MLVSHLSTASALGDRDTGDVAGHPCDPVVRAPGTGDAVWNAIDMKDRPAGAATGPVVVEPVAVQAAVCDYQLAVVRRQACFGECAAECGFDVAYVAYPSAHS